MLEPGSIIGGTYRLEQQLGKGGMGEVWLARHILLDEYRAIKIVLGEVASNSQLRERFVRGEARNSLRLERHPNIVRVYELGQHEGMPYMVMEYVEGQNLRELLNQRKVLSPREAGRYLEQVAAALDVAHRQGMVHRDIKPANVLIDQKGVLKLTDFGLTKALETGRDDNLTGTGQYMGTPAYVSPEQAQGEADQRSDIYSLGAMVYEMLVGRPPFVGTATAVIVQHVTTPPPPLHQFNPKVPALVEQVVLKTLAKRPEERYQTALEFARAYNRALEHETQQAGETTPLTPPQGLAGVANRTNSATSSFGAGVTPNPEATLPAVPVGSASPARNRVLIFGIAGLVVALLLVAGILIGVLVTGGNKPATVAQGAATATLPNPAAGPTTITNVVNPTIAPIATAIPTSTPQPSATPEPTPTVTVAPTATPAPTATIVTTPTPLPTATPAPLPTATSAPPATRPNVRTLAGHSDRVIATAFSPDGKILATGSFDNTIKLWDMSTDREIKTLRGHSSGVRSVKFSPDGKTLVSGSNDTTIKIWDIETGRVLKTFSGHSDSASSVLFSPDGKILYSGSDDHTIKIWDIASGKELKTLNGHTAEINELALSPDGKILASASFDKTVRLWDTETGKELRVLVGHKDQIFSVAFSPDGKTLASASVDRTIRLWDVASGNEIKTLTGYNDEVIAVTFSPDGKTLATGGGNAEPVVKLWEVASGKELKSFTGHTSGIRSVAFSPDGKTLASGSRDTTVKLWKPGD